MQHKGDNSNTLSPWNVEKCYFNNIETVEYTNTILETPFIYIMN